jgi:hypothetical protein
VCNVFVVSINVGRPGILNYFDTEQILFIAAGLIIYCYRAAGIPVSCILCPTITRLAAGMEAGKNKWARSVSYAFA